MSKDEVNKLFDELKKEYPEIEEKYEELIKKYEKKTAIALNQEFGKLGMSKLTALPVEKKISLLAKREAEIFIRTQLKEQNRTPSLNKNQNIKETKSDNDDSDDNELITLSPNKSQHVFNEESYNSIGGNSAGISNITPPIGLNFDDEDNDFQLPLTNAHNIKNLRDMSNLYFNDDYKEEN